MLIFGLSIIWCDYTCAPHFTTVFSLTPDLFPHLKEARLGIMRQINTEFLKEEGF